MCIHLNLNTSDNIKSKSATHYQNTVVCTKEKQSWRLRGTTRHQTLLSKQGQRKRKTSAEKLEGGGDPRPPVLYPFFSYLLKLSRLDSGLVGLSFTLCFSSPSHPEKARNRRHFLLQLFNLHMHTHLQSPMVSLTCEEGQHIGNVYYVWFYAGGVEVFIKVVVRKKKNSVVCLALTVFTHKAYLRLEIEFLRGKT